MEKTFTIAGWSMKNNVVSSRVANGTIKSRTVKLERDGHTDIQLQLLPLPMTKEHAIAWLKGTGVPIIPETPAVTEQADTSDDPVKWLDNRARPQQDPDAVMYPTFEAALAAVPTHSDLGNVISKDVRAALARDMVAE